MTVLLTLWMAAAQAQSEPVPEDPAVPAEDALGEIDGIPPGPRPDPAAVQELSYDIGAKLRCPVCQGLSVADSTSAAAVQMQNRVRELVAAGYSEDQIEAYFAERYGEWILLEPTAKGNLLIWLGPGLALGLGLAWATFVILKWRKEPDEVPLPSDVGLVPKDRYEERLLAELED